MDGPSRRTFLRGVGAAAAAGVAGCTALGGDDGSRVAVDGDPAATATTQFRGGLRRQGVYPDASVPASVETAWSVPEVNTGEHTAAKASPVELPGGDLVVPGDSGELYRVAPDGTVQWSTVVTGVSRGMHGTPAVANGAVYIGAYDGGLYAYDAESGERYWRASLGDAIGSSPGYHDGVVYIAVEYDDPSGAMFGVDAVTGEVVWEDHRPTDHPHSTCAIDREAGRLVVGANDGVVYAWSYPDLERQWTFETGRAIKGPVATADGSAFVGSWDSYVYRVGLADGAEEWAFETGNFVMSGPAVEESTGTVYVGSHDTHLYALDIETGDRRWAFDTGGQIIGCPTVTSEHVCFGSHDHHLYAVEKDTGEEAWQVGANGIVSSTPLVADGAVYYADRASPPYLNGETTDGEGSGQFYKVVADGDAGGDG